jgi:hypothetical protein
MCKCSTTFFKCKANTHWFTVLHFSTSVGYKGEITMLANLVYFMYAWYQDGHIVSLCRVCSSFVHARPVRLAYQPPASSTFLSQQTSHQQPASSTFLSQQISISHQPPAKRTGWQYVGNARTRNGQSMELGGVGEGGAVGRNSSSPPLDSAAAIGTAVAPGPNGTSTSAGISTSVAPGPNGTSTSAGIGTSAILGGDATSSSADGNDSSGLAEPHGTTFSPTAQAATSVVAH